MRNRVLVTAVLLIAVGGGSAESVATSPECERWIADYRHKFAESQPVEAISRKKRTLKQYIHRKIGTPASATPKLVRAASPRDPLRPSLTPQQMIKRFQVLCGDLPPVETAQLLPPVPPPAAPLSPLAVPGADAPGTPITTPGSPAIPATPGGGGPGGGTTTPGGPGGPTTTPPTGPPTGPPGLPPTSPPDGPPAPPVPEPSSLVLMLTGSLLAMGYAIRRGISA